MRYSVRFAFGAVAVLATVAASDIIFVKAQAEGPAITLAQAQLPATPAPAPAPAATPGQMVPMGSSGTGMGMGSMGPGSMGGPAASAPGQPMQQMPMGHGMMGWPMLGMSGQDGMRGMTGNGPMESGSMATQVESRLVYLKAELGITEAQAAAWKQYEDSVKSRTSPMQGMRQEMMKVMQAGTVAERMNARVNMMEGMVTSMKAQGVGLENLYQGLTADQKTKADQFLGMGMM